MSELRYAQEYLGKFLDELRTFFNCSDISNSCTLKRPQEIKTSGVFSLGVDIARLGGDTSTFEIIRRIGKDNVSR